MEASAGRGVIDCNGGWEKRAALVDKEAKGVRGDVPPQLR